jgi:hypothetical protein
MSIVQQLDHGRDSSPVRDLLSVKSPALTHPDEVVADHELTLADKRTLLASWASDALAVENRPSLRQLPRGAVVPVDDIMAALRSLDVDEHRDEKSLAFARPFARRGSRPSSRRRTLRPNDDDKPPPYSARCAVPPAGRILIGAQRRSPYRQLIAD